jgi:penicillin-binding protein 1B
MKLHSSRRWRLILISSLLITTIEAAFFATAYFAAMRYLREHDPRLAGPVNGTTFYARPKVLHRGQAISREEVIAHLTQIGYLSRESMEGGVFHLSGNSLQINSRLPEFQGATLNFKAGRIHSITVAGRNVERVELEPQALVSFIQHVRDDVAVRMNVRRIILQPTDLIPSALYDAIVSSEDRRFESHNGIDEFGMLKGLLAGRGGSTITQQMVKNVILADHSRTVERKGKEVMLALAAERLLSKEEIITAYANNCYLGHVVGGPVIFGFAAAALEFFGTADVKSLRARDAAALAGLLNQPEFYLKAARKGVYTDVVARRNRVLDLMRENFPDRYEAEEIAQAKAEPVEFLFTSERAPRQPADLISKPFQTFAADRADQLLCDVAPGASLRIYTTMDADLQAGAYKAVVEQLARLDTIVERIKSRRHQGTNPLQAALVALDARTGEILAMVGGRDGEFNRALARRSPGSAIKPFIYLKAIERGRHNGPFTAATIIDPANDPVDDYRPRGHVGPPARVRTLLARSDNGAAVVAAHDARLVDVRSFIYQLTGSRSDKVTGMLAIGGSAGSEVSPLSLASAYTIFPNNGLKLNETPFAAVYQNGVKLDIARPALTRAVDAGCSFVLTQMMRSVVGHGPDGRYGTARHAMQLAGLPARHEVSGKTGTGEVSDFWFVGFTPRIIVVVWAGMDDNTPLKLDEGFDGARVALPIWAEFMRAVKKHRPDLLEGRFEQPGNVQALRIDPKRGCITSKGGIEEYFIKGREPEICGTK